VDGKVVTSNHISISPPNGRLPPMPSNYPQNTSTPLPSHISQPHPNSITPIPPYTLDGGVYQGQPPTQPNHWNANTRVNSFIFEKIYFSK
jgi:hypothetical protein